MSGRAMDNDDASIADLPWASVFDPANNVRALGAIQDRGFRAATERRQPIRPDDRQGSRRRQRAALRAEARGRGCRDLSGSGPDTHISAERREPAGSIGARIATQHRPKRRLDLVNSASSGQAVLEADRARADCRPRCGCTTAVRSDMGKVRLRCSDLLSHDGALIASSCVRFEPDIVPMPARCSRGVTVEVDVATIVRRAVTAARCSPTATPMCGCRSSLRRQSAVS